MAGLQDILGTIGLGSGSGSGFLTIAMYVLIGGAGLAVAAGFAWYMIWKRKSWNIKVEFRIPRNVRVYDDNDGNKVVQGTITKEWGKGFYDAKKGVVFVKRKGVQAIAMKPFDIKRYLSAPSNILTVTQVGAEDYRPVLEDSYVNAEGEDGEPAALANVKIDTTSSKAWKAQWERESKTTYSITGLLHEYSTYIGQALVLFTVIVGFAIVYTKVG